MLRLLKIELHKVLYNRTVLVILGLYLLLLAPMTFGIDNLLSSTRMDFNGTKVNPLDFVDFSVFNFPAVWQNMAYLASWFQFLLAVVVVALVTNEYSFKTLRQNLIDGMSKWEVIWAKEIIILCISLFAVLAMMLLTFILGKNVEGVSPFSGMEFALAFFMSLFLYLNFAYFLSSLIKRPGLVIGMLLLYSFVLERVISFKLPDEIAQLLPMHVMNGFTPNPFGRFLGQSVQANFSFLNIGLWAFYLCLFIGSIYWMLKRGHAGK